MQRHGARTRVLQTPFAGPNARVVSVITENDNRPSHGSYMAPAQADPDFQHVIATLVGADPLGAAELVDLFITEIWRKPAVECPVAGRSAVVCGGTRRWAAPPVEEINVEPYDDDLSRFAADGAAPLPVTDDHGYVEHDGARIWYATYGTGPPVILLHGGLGHSGNWGYQVLALLRSGYRAVVIDSRGHGRSTRDARPFTYERMAADVAAVMDALHLETAALVGWSDGACTALMLAANAPTRVAGVFFFACNMDPSGVKPITELTPILRRCLGRHAQDYARLSATPDQFDAFAEAVGLMQKTQPNHSASDLAAIRVPVAIVQSEHDEFITRDHAAYLARSIPNATFIMLDGVSHFAPLQRPAPFNRALLAFLGTVLG